MSVRGQAAAFFEGLSRADATPPKNARSQSATTDPLINVQDHKVVSELPPRPRLATRQKTAPPVLKPKPAGLRARPAVPRNLGTDDGVLPSRAITEEPPRILLLDLEADSADDASSTPSRIGDEAVFNDGNGFRSSSPSKSPQIKALEKARDRTMLLAGSVIDTGRQKGKEAGLVIGKSAAVVGKTAVRLKDDTVQAIEKSPAPKVFDEVTGTIKLEL